MTPHSSTPERSNTLALFESSQPETTGMRGLAARDLSKAMSLFELDESFRLLLDSALEAAEENNGQILQELQQALLDYCEAVGDRQSRQGAQVRGGGDYNISNRESSTGTPDRWVRV
jgi:hypothetical protein